MEANRAYERGIKLSKNFLPILKTVTDRAGDMRPSIVKESVHPATLKSSVNTEPIVSSLSGLQPLTLELVSRTPLETLWDQLVSTFHYLGYQNLLGHRLKYLVFSKSRPVAALSWSAPALKLRARDYFIGWSDTQRKKYLNRVANNSRFLILPWVKVTNLASHVLSLNVRHLKKDWQQHFNTTLLLLETFVDPQCFKATSYKAANWHFIGHTYGYRKQGKGYVHHGVAKEVYVYVLNSKFRNSIGCKQKGDVLFQRPPQSLLKVEELQMILKHSQWHPNLVPCMELTEHDVEVMADELVTFHKQFHNCYGRLEHQRLGLAYLSGLLSNAKAKSVEPIALEFLDEHAVRSLQRFMKDYCWDHDNMEGTHQAMLSEVIADPLGMINVDSSEFVKKGKESVGVARQYCGAVGKVENCQSGVFVGYSSPKGYGLLTCQLYMPEIWFSKEYEQRRKDNLVPEDSTFQTKPQIALALINTVEKTNLFSAQWIGCDATFGSDLHFLKSLPEHLYYFAGIRSDTKVFLEKPKVGLPVYKGRGRYPKTIRVLSDQPQALTVAQLAGSRRLSFKPVILAEGAKGPIIVEAARIRVYLSRDGLPEDNSVWLFIRRNSDGQIKFAISNAPEDIPFRKLCTASTMRWPIEQCFKEGKNQIGMDHYEHRSWPAWHRHMVYAFLALHFLFRLRIRFKKNSLLDSATGSHIDCSHVTDSIN